jgi:hypothetical protein
VVLFASPLSESDVIRIPLLSINTAEKSKVLETCNRYDTAPGEAFQVTQGFVETPVEPFAGEASVGVVGASGTVVKVHTVE